MAAFRSSMRCRKSTPPGLRAISPTVARISTVPIAAVPRCTSFSHMRAMISGTACATTPFAGAKAASIARTRSVIAPSRSPKVIQRQSLSCRTVPRARALPGSWRARPARGRRRTPPPGDRHATARSAPAGWQCAHPLPVGWPRSHPPGRRPCRRAAPRPSRLRIAGRERRDAALPGTEGAADTEAIAIDRRAARRAQHEGDIGRAGLDQPPPKYPPSAPAPAPEPACRDPFDEAATLGAGLASRKSDTCRLRQGAMLPSMRRFLLAAACCSALAAGWWWAGAPGLSMVTGNSATSAALRGCGPRPPIAAP